MVTVNVVVLAGTVAADPVERRMPSGDEVPVVSDGSSVGRQFSAKPGPVKAHSSTIAYHADPSPVPRFQRICGS